MGMTCTLRRVPETDFARRLAMTPEEFTAEIRAEDEREMAASGLEVRRVLPRNPVLRFLARLLPVTVEEAVPRADAPTPPPGGWPSTRDDLLDLEGVWHPLHFLLTGTAWEGDAPASFLLAGGVDVGDDDDDPIRALAPEDVRRFATHLASLSRDELARRHDPARMAALAVRGAPLANVLDAFDELRRFVAEAADAGDGLLVRVS